MVSNSLECCKVCHSDSIHIITSFTAWFFPWIMPVSTPLKDLADLHWSQCFPPAFPSFLKESMGWVSATIYRTREWGEMLSHCSFPGTILNKASVRLALICICTVAHLKHTDSLKRKFIMEKGIQPCCEGKHFWFPYFLHKTLRCFC